MVTTVAVSTGTYDFRVARPGVVAPAVVPQGAAQEDHEETIGELVLSPFRRQAGRRVRPCVRGGLKGRRVDEKLKKNNIKRKG